MAHRKGFRYDPQTGEIWESCDRPGKGLVAAQLFGSQMPYNNLYRRQLPDGTYEVRAYTHTEARRVLPEEGWELAWTLRLPYGAWRDRR